MSKNDRFLMVEHLKGDLKRHTVGGGLWTFSAQGIKFLIGFIAAVILARLLTPTDFGLVAMVMVVVNFVEAFKDIGLAAATVQKEEISHLQVSSLFWINSGVGVVVSLLLISISPAIAWFYDEKTLILITVALALGTLTSGFGVQHQALLVRQMRFRTLAVVEISSMVAGTAVGIIMALCACGYWALVFKSLITTGFMTIGLWLGCGWRPSLPVKNSGVKPMLSFGGNVTGSSLINFLVRNADNALIGWRWGSESLGFYSRAYSLLLLPLQQIIGPARNVVVPALSRLQNNPDRYRNYYLKTVFAVTFLTMPILTVLALMSEEFIALVLGQQWVGASTIFAVLGIAAILTPIVETGTWLQVSIGRPERMLRLSTVSGVMTLAAFLVGLPFGALGVAVSYSVACFLSFWAVLWYSCKFTPVRVGDIFRMILPVILASVCCAVALTLFKHVAPILSTGLSGLLIAGALSAVLLLIVLSLSGGLSQVKEIISLLRYVNE